jgi:hypothetical protein
MSNKRRKSIGSAKIARNRTLRVVRGALKAGNPLPGCGFMPVEATAALRQHSDKAWQQTQALEGYLGGDLKQFGWQSMRTLRY